MGKELFTNIPSKVKNLVDDVRIGKIGLPDLQRPFVWKDNKVRDLFDSMLRGYPIGYVMLWESPSDYEEKKSSIGGNKKIYEEPKELVIDGQQRLTALVAAMYGVKVRDKCWEVMILTENEKLKLVRERNRHIFEEIKKKVTPIQDTTPKTMESRTASRDVRKKDS